MPITRKLVKQGNQRALPLSVDICAALGVDAGDELEIVVLKDFLIVMKPGAAVDRGRIALALGQAESEPKRRGLKPSEHKAFQHLELHSVATPEEVAAATDMKLVTAQRALDNLVELGLALRNGLRYFTHEAYA